MKLIGLLGGMSWESTSVYYRAINELVQTRLGGLHSARCLLYSVEFAEIAALQHAGEWEAAGALLGQAAQSLERGGAACVVLCTNTMHNVAEIIQAHIALPLLHIADPTAAAIRAGGLRRIGLLGTRFTMEQDFYSGRLRDRHGLEVLVPEADDRALIHQVIYDELCRGIVRPESRARYLDVIGRLAAAGAEAVILGCTEIGMLIHQADCPLPLFDTTLLHAGAAVDFALSPSG